MTDRNEMTLETAEARSLAAGIVGYKSVDLGHNPMRQFGYLDGWNAALDAAIEDLLNLNNKHSCGCIDAIKKLKKESNE